MRTYLFRVGPHRIVVSTTLGQCTAEAIFRDRIMGMALSTALTTHGFTCEEL